MEFHALPVQVREREIQRVMRESKSEFTHEKVARGYIDIYERMLERPLVETESGEYIKQIARKLEEQTAGS